MILAAMLFSFTFFGDGAEIPVPANVWGFQIELCGDAQCFTFYRQKQGDGRVHSESDALVPPWWIGREMKMRSRWAYDNGALAGDDQWSPWSPVVAIPSP